jgi:hypothetical protein
MDLLLESAPLVSYLALLLGVINLIGNWLSQAIRVRVKAFHFSEGRNERENGTEVRITNCRRKTATVDYIGFILKDGTEWSCEESEGLLLEVPPGKTKIFRFYEPEVPPILKTRKVVIQTTCGKRFKGPIVDP